MKLQLLLATVLATALLTGCDKSETATSTTDAKPAGSPAAQSTPAPSSSAATSEPKVTALCPLCDGHQITVEPDTARFEFGGKTYYFCSEDCKKEFAADPAGQIAKLAAKAAQPTPGH